MSKGECAICGKRLSLEFTFHLKGEEYKACVLCYVTLTIAVKDSQIITSLKTGARGET